METAAREELLKVPLTNCSLAAVSMAPWTFPATKVGRKCPALQSFTEPGLW